MYVFRKYVGVPWGEIIEVRPINEKQHEYGFAFAYTLGTAEFV